MPSRVRDALVSASHPRLHRLAERRNTRCRAQSGRYVQQFGLRGIRLPAFAVPSLFHLYVQSLGRIVPQDVDDLHNDPVYFRALRIRTWRSVQVFGSFRVR